MPFILSVTHCDTDKLTTVFRWTLEELLPWRDCLSCFVPVHSLSADHLSVFYPAGGFFATEKQKKKYLVIVLYSIKMKGKREKYLLEWKNIFFLCFMNDWTPYCAAKPLYSWLVFIPSSPDCLLIEICEWCWLLLPLLLKLAMVNLIWGWMLEQMAKLCSVLISAWFCLRVTG